MNMLKNQCKQGKEKSSAAFTYIEVVVALIIISLIASVLFFSYSVCIKSINSSRKSVKSAVEYLNIDSYLRKKIESVSFPFWLQKYDYSFSDNEIVLSWLDGVKDKQIIKLPEEVRIIDIKPLLSENKRIKGLYIKYYIKKQECELKALFASRIYGTEEI